MTGVQCPDNPLLGEASGTKRVLTRDPFLDGRIPNQVLLNDALASRWSHFSIPDALWINQHPWAFAADSKTSGLGPQDWNPKFFDALFQNLPCLKPIAFSTAIRPYAEEDMPLRGFDAHFGKTGIDWIHSELRYKEVPESWSRLRRRCCR